MTQLIVNVTAILLAGGLTLAFQRHLYERRRRRHLGDGTRSAARLPEDRGRTAGAEKVRS
jgi:hypothetical protein